MPDDGLARFRDAQRDVWPVAREEIAAGEKRGHWMWFVFPQLAGLGRSATAQRYVIHDLAEARAYLADPLLGGRLCEGVALLAGWAGRRSAEAMLGAIDAVKLRSCCTLFEAAGGAPFAACLDRLFGGVRDPATLALLAPGSSTER